MNKGNKIFIFIVIITVAVIGTYIGIGDSSEPQKQSQNAKPQMTMEEAGYTPMDQAIEQALEEVRLERQSP